jgi:hypothetical protein
MSYFTQQENTMENIVANFQEALDASRLEEARRYMLAMFDYSEEEGRKMLKEYLAKKNQMNELILDYTNGV